MIKGNYLITTDEWFIAPNGQSYKSVWGDVTVLNDNALGVKTNARTSNWFAKVGSEENHVIIAGCQIHYIVKCEEKPDNSKPVPNWISGADKGITHYESPSPIYIAL